MYRAFLVGALLASSACGSETDDRPPTLAYVTEAILQPSCGKAECHSTFKQEVGDVFDTVEGARRSMVTNGLVVYTNTPTDSQLVTSITVGLPSILNPGGTANRMPYDAPLQDYDVDLIKKWIASGTPGGNGPEGAQCIPSTNNPTHGCNILGQIVECDNGNEGNVITDCTKQTPAMSCLEGVCVSN